MAQHTGRVKPHTETYVAHNSIHCHFFTSDCRRILCHQASRSERPQRSDLSCHCQRTGSKILRDDRAVEQATGTSVSNGHAEPHPAAQQSPGHAHQPSVGTPSSALTSYTDTNTIRSLPKLRKEAKESHDTVKVLLHDLPLPPSDNPVAELLRLVTSFCSEVNGLIAGAESHERLIQKCRPAYKTFKYDIRRTAPRFRPYESAKQDRAGVPDVTLDNEDDPTGEVVEEPPQTEPMYLQDVREHIGR